MIRAWTVLVTALLLASPAVAKAPPGQGRKCKAADQCEASLQCIKTRAGSGTCEIPCKDSSGCPEDQRCIADGPQKICRPITDL
jgi:hypothetical protein